MARAVQALVTRIRRVAAPFRYRAQHRPQTGPRMISDDARDDMQMELADQVSERADVNLLRLRVAFQKLRRLRRLFDQLRAIGRVEIVELEDSFAHGHENEPGPARVVH